MRLGWVFGVAGLIGAAGIGACVGSDPATAGGNGTPAQGEHLGACYPNGTCNQGLECRDTVCLNPGEAPPTDGGATSDGQTPPGQDGGSDAGDSGGDGACSAELTAHNNVPCENSGISCSAKEACCGDGTTSTCTNNNNLCTGAPSVAVGCLTESDCIAAGSVCCSQIPTIDETTCPPTVTLKQTICVIGTSCSGSGYPAQLCDKNNPGCSTITGTICLPVTVTIPGGGSGFSGLCSK